jgi:hypothetical protein
MRAKKDSTARLSDHIGGTSLLRFQTDIRNFHAVLSSLGSCFEGTTEIMGTSEVGLALLFILLGAGEVVLLDEGPVHYC